jgi:hypothetical protein
MSAAPLLTDDDRFDVLQAAAGAERRNRPMTLVVLAAIALLLTGMAALLGWWSMLRAERELGIASEAAATTDRHIAELTALREALGDEGGGAPESGGPVLSQIRDLATSSGVTSDIGFPREASQPRGEFVRNDYSYKVTDELGPMLRWLTTATERVQGLMVRSVILRPNTNGDGRWNLDVTFSRWESK